MPSLQPALAPGELRLLACAIDGMVVMVAVTVVFVMGETAGLSPMLAAAASPVLYVAYHSIGLRAPRMAIGRSAAGIAVVSTQHGGEITQFQAVVRPAVRVLALGLAVIASVSFDQTWMLAVPLVAELALIAHLPWRQSVADLAARTLVVRMPQPQPQPHRAPAGPMYSAADAEFGPAPRRPGTGEQRRLSPENVSQSGSSSLLPLRRMEVPMRKLLGIIAAATLAAPPVNAAAPAPQSKASDTARSAFIRKCFRDQTKRSCTAPPEARAKR